jgi:diguanylate cyclase (GGDEF)-like protein
MNIIDRITTIGFNPALTTNEQMRIKLINISAILALINIFSFNITYFIIDLKSTFVMSLILCMFVIPYGYVFALNSKRKYSAAKLLYLITSTTSIIIPSLFLGDKFGFQNLFLAIAMGPFLYYSFNEYLKIIMITILNVSAYCYIEFFYKSQFLPLNSVIMKNSIVLVYNIASIFMCYITLAMVLVTFQLAILKEDKELKTALDKVTRLANYDGLTNLYNRRAFNEIMMDEVNRIINGEFLSMIITDIDFFKKVNDTFGHLIGDEVLKKISDELKINLRENDLIARWGGEEFIVMLPHTDILGAKMVAEKLRLCVQELSFPSDMHITMSFGVSQHLYGEDISNTIKKADDALYKAKHNGRNRVEII